MDTLNAKKHGRPFTGASKNFEREPQSDTALLKSDHHFSKINAISYLERLSAIIVVLYRKRES
jgi:hypothetical protein